MFVLYDHSAPIRNFCDYSKGVCAKTTKFKQATKVVMPFSLTYEKVRVIK